MSVRRPASPTGRPQGRAPEKARSGSTRATAPPRAESPRRPAPSARTAGQARAVPATPPKGLSRRAAVYLALLLVLLVSLFPSLRAYTKQTEQLDSLRADVAAKQGQVAQLDNQLARWKDNAYVIAQAREQFTYVFPGETAYIVNGQTRAVTDGRDPAGAAAREASRAKGPWYSTLWGSVTQAGDISPADVSR